MEGNEYVLISKDRTVLKSDLYHKSEIGWEIDDNGNINDVFSDIGLTNSKSHAAIQHSLLEVDNLSKFCSNNFKFSPTNINSIFIDLSNKLIDAKNQLENLMQENKCKCKFSVVIANFLALLYLHYIAIYRYVKHYQKS